MWGWVLLSFVVLTISFLSLLPPRSWYFRVWLYGYRQLGWLHLSLLCSSFLFVFGWIWILTFLHAGFVVWITRHIYPYWSFSSKEVADCNRDAEEEHVRMLFANVLQSNENIDRFRQLIHYYQPDLVFAVETDRRWSEALTAEPGYDWQVACPLDNLYGMTLISRLPTIKPVIRYSVQSDVPSLSVELDTPKGHRFRFLGLHPRPPSPTEHESSLPKDQEMVLVAQEIRRYYQEDPVVVGGDMNDVGWSNNTRLFQRISGLLDPRRGRGFFPTFPVRFRALTFPIDHVFCSAHFTLHHMEVGPAFGSDHLPLYIELCLHQRSKDDNANLSADREDLHDAASLLQESIKESEG